MSDLSDRIEQFQNKQAGVAEYAISVLKSKPHLFVGEIEAMDDVGTVSLHHTTSLNYATITVKGMDALEGAGLRIRVIKSLGETLEVNFERTE